MNRLQRFLVEHEDFRAQRKRSLAMSLGPEDLPGEDWKMRKEHVYRTGSNSAGGEIAERALKAGGFTIWREFMRGEGVGFWAQVDRCGSAEDAVITVKSAPKWGKKNPDFDVEVTHELIFDGEAIPGVTSFQRQERGISSKAGAQLVTSVYGSVEEIFFALSGLVTWELVNEIAALQADKIRRVLTPDA